MKRIRNKVVATLAVLMLINGSSLTVLADDVNMEQFATEIQRVSTIEKSEIIYVIENHIYNEMLQKDFAIIEDNRHLLVLEGETPNKKELEIIEASEKFYLMGEFSEFFEEEITLKENYAGNMFGFNKYEAASVLAAESGTDKDIIIANGESLSDSVTASQIGLLENKNVLLVEEKFIPYFTGDYLEAYGKGKQITFVEGELLISDDIKKQILQFTGDEKYSLDKLGLLKKDKITEENVGSETVMNELQGNEAVGDIINERIVRNMIDSEQPLVDAAKEASEQIKTELIKDNKVIRLVHKEETEVSDAIVEEVAEEIQEDIVIENNLVDFLNRENPSLVILQNEQIDAQMPEIVGQTMDAGLNSYVIKVTYATPFTGANPANTEVMVIIEPEPIPEPVVVVQAPTPAPAPAPKPVAKPKAVEKPVNMGPNIAAFLDSALRMKGWDYSQERRWDYGYADCSSIVIRAMLYSGVTKNSANMTTRSIHKDNRFYEIPMREIQVGDILWKEGHMEIFMGGNKTYGAFDYGKLVGYSTGINRFTKAYRISGK